MTDTVNYHNSRNGITVTNTTLMVGNCAFDITTAEGRMAARGYAYTVGADGDSETKKKILRLVGRDDG